jgi:hypothetical protein
VGIAGCANKGLEQFTCRMTKLEKARPVVKPVTGAIFMAVLEAAASKEV